DTSALFRFGLRHVVQLDERVNAQPLVWHDQDDVVYVVTANNTVYAINPKTGSVIWTKHLGDPVPACAGQQEAPLGILSTPVIDTQAQVMYLVAETLKNGDVAEDDYEVDPDPRGDPAEKRIRIDPPQIPVAVGKTHYIYAPRIPFGKHPEHKIHKIDLRTL